MMLLAQTATNFSAGQLGAAIGILLLGLMSIVAWRKVFNPEPPLHKEYVSRTDAEFLKTEVEKIDGERRTSVANLHTKVDTQIAGLRQELTSKIEKLENRIDAVPERTIKLLRETKDLL